MAQHDTPQAARTSRVREPEQDGLLHVDAEPLLRGCLRVTAEAGGWFRPRRFAEAQERSLASVDAWHPGLYRQMARCTAGVCLAFETDAATAAVELRVDPEPQGTADQLELVDGPAGPRLTHDGVSATVDGAHLSARLPQGTMERVVFDLGPAPRCGAHRVRVWLPWGRGCALRDVIANGSFVRALPQRPGLLVISDSIAQGFCVDDPAFAWPALAGEALALDVVNQGVGGQIFQASSLAGIAALERPMAVVVALGTNYAFAPFSAAVVRKDAKLFFRSLAQAFPGVPVLVATPTWRGPAARRHPRTAFDQVPELLREVVAAHEGMAVVDGLALLPHDTALLADGEDHPNQDGARLLAQALVDELLRVIVPPADAPRLVAGVLRAGEGYALEDARYGYELQAAVPREQPAPAAEPAPAGPAEGELVLAAESPEGQAQVEPAAEPVAAQEEPAPAVESASVDLAEERSAAAESPAAPAVRRDDPVARSSRLAEQLRARREAAQLCVETPHEDALPNEAAAHREALLKRFYAHGTLQMEKPRAQKGSTRARSSATTQRKRKARAKKEQLDPRTEPAPPKTRQLTLFDALGTRGAAQDGSGPVAAAPADAPADGPALSLVPDAQPAAVPKGPSTE